jgi:hypothetical protein
VRRLEGTEVDSEEGKGWGSILNSRYLAITVFSSANILYH